MWKPNQKCKVCALILNGDKELQRRIYGCKHFGNAGGESFQDIADSYGGTITKFNIAHHIKKHQNLTDADKVRRSTAAIASIQETRLVADQPVLKARPEDVWEQVLEQGLEDLKEGRIKISANNILKAAADKTTADLKKKDQELKITEMIWHFASGESNDSQTAYDRALLEGKAATDYDAAAITARSVESVTD
jgi:hypothetical protein